MKILVGLISSNEWILNKFTKVQHRLIPENKANGVNKFSFISYNPNSHHSDIQEKLRRDTKNLDGVILLIEKSHEDMFKKIEHSFFISMFQFKEDGNHEGFFRKKIGRLIENLEYLNKIAKEKSEIEQLIILPIRNFSSDDLMELARICRENNEDKTFQDMVGNVIKKLKQRRIPRRNSSKQKYIIDQNDRCFEFGKDISHGNPATGGNHLPSCEIASNFRFGRRISLEGHFNVTNNSRGNPLIGGVFPNCHDVGIIIREQSHINMFVNDQVRGEETIA